jgi:hypothetical protein
MHCYLDYPADNTHYDKKLIAVRGYSFPRQGSRSRGWRADRDRSRSSYSSESMDSTKIATASATVS